MVGRDLRERLTAAADSWLAELAGGLGPDAALVAVGSLGRRELGPGSDLDLLVVHRAGAVDVDRLWYAIWDAGEPLDHSVRTVAEALAVAGADLAVALGLLYARHLTGDAELTAELRTRVHAAWRAAAGRRLPELRAADEDRARRHGEVAFLLEPDLKLGRGGLRDAATLRALAAAQLAERPGPAVEGAAELLLDVRGELRRRRSAGDRLVLQEQGPIAGALGLAGAEELARAVSAAGRTISYAWQDAWARLDRTAPRRRLLRRAPVRVPLADGVVAQDGEVVLAAGARPAADPALALRVAAAAAAHRLPVARFTLDRLAAEHAGPADGRWTPEMLDALLALLGTGEAAVGALETLDAHGLFERLLPEWGQVRCKPQRNPYHQFTVDRHLMETAARAAALARRVTRPDLLLLAALLHDIGKGWPGDHTEEGVRLIGELAPRLGLAPADGATITTLVRHHLLLADAATRRDLDDPATVHSVAEAVGDQATLDLLAALTEADGLATGATAWSAWKAGLVADLVERARLLLAGEALPPPALTVAAERLLADPRPALRPEAGLVHVTGPATANLLAVAAGVLALHGMDIRAASCATRGGWTAVSLQAHPRFGSEPDWTLAQTDLLAALDGTLPLAERVARKAAAYPPAASAAPAVVRWDDAASPTATVLDLRAPDAMGLLFRVTSALGAAGVEVRAARCSTLGADVVDAFYLPRELGPARRAEVAAAVLAILAP
ncbi:MAG: [protein-PII] uridylyltransferase [Mycobacteriales bacterium]